MVIEITGSMSKSDKTAFKVFNCEIKNLQLVISPGASPQKQMHSFQIQLVHIEYFEAFCFFPILVFQNISFANSNACKCNDSSESFVFLLLTALLSANASFLTVFRMRRVNHMVGSCKVMK